MYANHDKNFLAEQKPATTTRCTRQKVKSSVESFQNKKEINKKAKQKYARQAHMHILFLEITVDKNHNDDGMEWYSGEVKSGALRRVPRIIKA